MDETSAVPDDFSVRDWKTRAERGWRFARDEINLMIGARASDGAFYAVEPVTFTMRRLSETEQYSTPSLTIRHDLGERLIEALVPFYIGTDVGNVLSRIRELERQRDKAVSQLDALIAGIGRLGAS